jgi:hypothetical protein
MHVVNAEFFEMMIFYQYFYYYMKHKNILCSFVFFAFFTEIKVGPLPPPQKKNPMEATSSKMGLSFFQKKKKKCCGLEHQTIHIKQTRGDARGSVGLFGLTLQQWHSFWGLSQSNGGKPIILPVFT